MFYEESDAFATFVARQDLTQRILMRNTAVTQSSTGVSCEKGHRVEQNQQKLIVHSKCRISSVTASARPDF